VLLHQYDLGLPLDALVRETRRAVAGWDWSVGAFGHALSLPAYAELHPYGRYSYPNFPCTGLLGQCPLFREIFEDLRCEKVSFRLLRREPQSSYAWHTDRWKGPGVVRFQIPIVSDAAAFLVTTDYVRRDQIEGAPSAGLTEASFAAFARANAGRCARHQLEPGLLYYFDTTRVHTFVNPGPGERITLSFDLLANDWVRERFPEVREEIGDTRSVPLPCPGPLQLGLAFARSRFYPVRNRVRAWLHAN
jgi:hypothetical protein